jgi:hypothetical protein
MKPKPGGQCSMYTHTIENSRLEIPKRLRLFRLALGDGPFLEGPPRKRREILMVIMVIRGRHKMFSFYSTFFETLDSLEVLIFLLFDGAPRSMIED